jgi:hypothetical protein
MLNSTFIPDIHNKRKHCDINYNCKIINTTGSKLYDKYYNVLNCDKVEMIDNHIYFDSLVNKESIDCIRSFAPNFIFTTSLPPCIAYAAQTSVKILK